MDKAQYVQKRKAKYMAQTLEGFEEMIEPHLPPEAREAIESFKALARRRFGALATDATEIMSLSDAGAVNGVALDMRDSLSPVGKP